MPCAALQGLWSQGPWQAIRPRAGLKSLEGSLGRVVRVQRACCIKGSRFRVYWLPRLTLLIPETLPSSSLREPAPSRTTLDNSSLGLVLFRKYACRYCDGEPKFETVPTWADYRFLSPRLHLEVQNLGSRSEVPPGLWPLLQPRKLSFLEHEPTTAQLVESKEYDSALVLVEATALEALKYAEKNSIDPGAISKPMLSFLQQVCVEAPSFNPSIEHRRLEFLSSCSPFFKHWSEEVLRDALTRILAPIRSPHPEAHKAQQKGIKLEQRALSTFVSVCKSGVLRANQLEAPTDQSSRADQRF